MVGYDLFFLVKYDLFSTSPIENLCLLNEPNRKSHASVLFFIQIKTSYGLHLFRKNASMYDTFAKK